MEKPSYDPGLTNQFGNTLTRAINRNGTFNVRREGESWRAFHPWLTLINMSWPGFISIILAGWLVANLAFALAYFELDASQLQGGVATDEFHRFLNDFFFSAQTLTTVGYGGLLPRGVAANFVASLEALLGLMAFAVGTGLLLGRISRPSARIRYSGNAIVAPYQTGSSLQFRIVNERRNNIMELGARVMLMTVIQKDGRRQRKFDLLRLERDSVVFFPLTWTVVHPIEEDSPLNGKTPADLEQLQAELLILVKGFDDTFSQTVFSRYSYRYDEIVWDTRFAPAFRIDDDGDIVLEMDRVGALENPGRAGF